MRPRAPVPAAVPAAVVGAGLALVAVLAAAPAAAQSDRCASESAALAREQAELPRLGVAPPGDRQMVCITLETNIAFARRLFAHAARCPQSPSAKDAEAWRETESSYAARFGEQRCKPAIKPFRG